MKQGRKPKVLILENREPVREKLERILVKQGWSVTCARVSKDALTALEQAHDYIFTLFISNYKLPKMEGDDILQKVKVISPLTKRMLMVPSDNPDILISAINKAEIHACIITPFQDEDLILQTRNCFNQFRNALKQSRLKRVTVHQNKQMFQIAHKLKKKEEVYRQRIAEKKRKKARLLKQQSDSQNTDPDERISLSRLVAAKKILAGPEAFGQEFLSLGRELKALFKTVAQQIESAPFDPGPKAPVESEAPGEKDKQFSKHILGALFSKALQQDTADQAKAIDPDAESSIETDHHLDGFLEVTLSKSQTKAYIQKRPDPEGECLHIELEDVLDLLTQKQITCGLIDEDAIKEWLTQSPEDRILVARGIKSIPGQDGTVRFFFQTDFTNPGKINEDGSIDFRERGDIPYVKKGTLLAEKTMPQEGRSGITVSGIQIPVDEVTDPVFLAGSGAELSDDGLKIHAAVDGQPHCDALGSVSVNSELEIPGDVDYRTGNIHFNGNIVVKGMVKEGFSVKGINLTVSEIEGGVINLSGDLNVSAGITDATVSVHGNIYAKFINNSEVLGFQDLSVSREIIDSKILLSGSCQNQTGHIIASRISAKLGIEAGKVGTPSSGPSHLKVGIDEHVEARKEQITAELEASVTKTDQLKAEMKKLEDHDQKLYQEISEKAQLQDRTQIGSNALKEQLKAIEDQTDPQARKISDQIRKLDESAKKVELELNEVFKIQDRIAKDMERIKVQVDRMEARAQLLDARRKALSEFSKKTKPNPVVTIAKTMIQDTTIRGPHSNLSLREDVSRCRIMETMQGEDGLVFHEMKIADL